MANLSVNLNAIAYLRNRRDLPWPSVVDLARLALGAGADGVTVHPRPDELCEVVRPDQVTLVPDDPAQSTSDHGWDIRAQGEMLAQVIERLQNGGMRVSLFIDADPAIPALAAEVGADRVELYTGPYGDPAGDAVAELARLRATAEACRKAGLRAARGGAGLGVNAGHDLTLDNLPALVQAIPDLEECSIGHALTADALKFGLGDAVRRYVAILGGGGH
jgi:pyridoxine 5-phosphate synthase